jgi:hypothetical protein
MKLLPLIPTLHVNNLLKDIIVPQVIFGMTSKMLVVAGMKTESEFPDVYLDFIRQ